MWIFHFSSKPHLLVRGKFKKIKNFERTGKGNRNICSFEYVVPVEYVSGKEKELGFYFYSFESLEMDRVDNIFVQRICTCRAGELNSIDSVLLLLLKLNKMRFIIFNILKKCTV